MPDINPHRDEMLSLLRRADCHYGNTLCDEEAGWTVDHAARERNVQASRIVELRRAVRAAADGQFSRTKAQAGHEDGVLRALLQFRNRDVRRAAGHVHARLVQLQREFGLRETVQPLRCVTRGAQARRVRMGDG